MGLTVATGFILYSTVYLPFYGGLKSHVADFEKEKLEKMKDAGPKGGGSMWSNMNAEIIYNNKTNNNKPGDGEDKG